PESSGRLFPLVCRRQLLPRVSRRNITRATTQPDSCGNPVCATGGRPAVLHRLKPSLKPSRNPSVRCAAVAGQPQTTEQRKCSDIRSSPGSSRRFVPLAPAVCTHSRDGALAQLRTLGCRCGKNRAKSWPLKDGPEILRAVFVDHPSWSRTN